MKLLYLTSLITQPNELGEKKIQKALKNGKRRGNDEEETMWEKLGIPNPDEGNEEDIPEISEDGFLKLAPGEFEYDFVDCIVRLSEFSCAIDDQEIGSVVYLKDGSEVWVAESSEEIFGYILHLDRGWFTALCDKLEFAFYSFLRKFQKNKVKHLDISKENGIFEL